VFLSRTFNRGHRSPGRYRVSFWQAMLESVLTVRWLDGDRVETVWRSRGDPDPGDRRFHSSSKPAGDRVHINAQITTIW